MRPIIELPCNEARAFFLKQKSYFKIDLPSYFQFNDLLSEVAEVLDGKHLPGMRSHSPRKHEDVNYLIFSNKDGRYDWRAPELIHPALYISLVNEITEHTCWESIRDRFRRYNECTKVKCLSLPVKSATGQKNKVDQIRPWRRIEQKSIESSLDYEFVIHTDIVACYASIYTHSIAWALHTKPIAKENRDDQKLIGNIIDNHIQDMRQGQTNGIPQGSALMDFIAEMVLGYADTELTEKINNEKIEDHQILRYRDDYRIFVNNPQDGERILKCLTEVMIELGMKLNPLKTDISSEVISSSMKNDKLNWMLRRQSDENLQKHLLIIYQHSMENPNAGSVVDAMHDYHNRLNRLSDVAKRESPLPLISIVADIAYRNPKTYSISAAILGRLVSFLTTDSDKQSVAERIKRKFSQIPNTGYMQIWLQRISLPFDPDTDIDEPLCRLVRSGGEQIQIWENKWISSKDLLEAINPNKIIDLNEFDTASNTSIVPDEEVKLFTLGY